SIFKTRGFTDEDIYYINHIDTQDLDGDGVVDGIVDQTEKTVDTFQHAVQWAEAQANDGPLYLYVVNHGEKNATFLIDKGQILTAPQFDTMLDSFEDSTSRVSIVMLEACYSGSFIDPLADTDRVIFSSSAADKYSFLNDAGDVSFSQFLSTYLLSGYNWEASFDLAANDLTGIGKPYAGMNPQKVIGSQVVPGQVFGDFSMASFLPEIDPDSYTAGGIVDTNMAQTFSVTLDMLDTGGVSVWATVTPPNYQPPTVTGEYTTPLLGLDTFTLTSADGSKTFTGSYTFPCNGTYQVTYYVKDSSGNVVSTAPQAFVATGGKECDFVTSLSPAWNLVSLPVIPDDPSVDKILGDIEETVASVWKWVDGKWAVYLPGYEDGGAAYASSKDFGQLTDIGCGEGFWVNASTDLSLSVSGSPPSNTSCSLTEGWNLIGLKSDAATAVADFVSGNEDKIASVWKWDNEKWAVYLPGEDDGGAAYAQGKEFALLVNINPGEGFWVNCTQAVTAPMAVVSD
ncbi:MAG: C13 family peptidase, partial [Desulfotignum sp.]|nr:C13 family peptidase [Desulfotignum sp.]